MGMIRAQSYGMLCILTTLSLVRCNCSDASLQNAGLGVPRIDVCVVPEPGADEVCYEALKADGLGAGCEDDGTCSRPELIADMGRLLAGQSGTTPVTVKNLGEAPLTFFNPTEHCDRVTTDLKNT